MPTFSESMPSSSWAGLLRDDRASIVPVMAMVAMVAMSGAALAVDLARAYALRQQLQLTADAAALAAAINLPDQDAARKAAYRYAERNMPGYAQVISADGIEFGRWNPETRQLEPDSQTPSAVKVTPQLTAANGNPLRTLFASLIGNSELDVAASAVAGKRSPMCILALEPEEGDALGLDISAAIEASNCTVQVNSRHKWAFRMFLGSKFLAGGLCVTGNAYVSMFSRATPEPTIGCPPQPDPLMELLPPETAGCDFYDTVHEDRHGTLQPGVYCGGLVIAGASDIDLAAGTFVIKDGPLAIGDTSEVSGDGVTFYLTGEKALIDFSDDSQLSLTAPTSGDMTGILVFQDRNFGGDHLWDSNAPTTLHGTIYLPEGRVMSSSSNAITPINSCNVLIAKSLRFKYKSSVSIDLSQKHCQQYLPSALLGAVALLD